MPSAPRPFLVRTGIAAFATLAVAGTLISCSSDADDSSAAKDSAPKDSAPKDDVHSEAASSTAAPTRTADPNATPADAADTAEITALVDEFFRTSNAQDADGFLLTLCEEVLPEYEGIENASPVVDPIKVDDISDIVVNADVATANITIAMGQGGTSQSETVPYKFVQEEGEWKVWGNPE